MEYRVILTESASADLAEIFETVIQEAPLRGSAWATGMLDSIMSLASMPNRCPLARESRTSGRTIRCLLIGKGHGIYRCLYLVDQATQKVFVIHVRHGARADLSPDQLARPE
jgi:plasmid stabilization system protein ParE